MIEMIQPVLLPDQWVANYADLLYGYIYLRVNNKALAEDLVQDTFLSAWKSRSTYNSSSSEKNWLFAICKNKLIDYFRKSKSAVINHQHSRYFDDKDHWTSEAAPAAWDVSHLPDSDEFYKVLGRCRARLTKSQSAVFSMKYIDDMDAKQICSLMNISVQNYWVLIHRAKLQLRECLQVNWIEQ